MKEIVIALLVGLFITSFFFANEVESLDESYKSKVGTYFTINKDSFLIIDYDLLNETFKLSNGTEINKKLVP